jgi:hypothetical protein
MLEFMGDTTNEISRANDTRFAAQVAARIAVQIAPYLAFAISYSLCTNPLS